METYAEHDWEGIADLAMGGGELNRFLGIAMTCTLKNNLQPQIGLLCLLIGKEFFRRIC